VQVHTLAAHLAAVDDRVDHPALQEQADPASWSISTDSNFSHSGSIIGDHVTTSRKALRRSRQCATGLGPVEPHCSGGAPATASSGSRSRISDVK
jgi:hypothetical protein